MRVISIAVAALSIAAMSHSIALAEENSSLANAIKGLEATVDFYPKPWPLVNLISPGVLSVALTGESPPMDFIDTSTGELTGAVHDLYQKIGEDLGLEVQFTKLAFAGTLPGLKANSFDIACAGAAWTAERLGSQDFHMTSPIGVNGTLGVTTKSTGITSWNDTAGKRLGGVTGEVFLRDAREKLQGLAEVTEFPGSAESLLALSNGQVDFIVQNMTVINHMLKNAPNKDDLVLIGPPLSIYPTALCVNPRETDLLKAVNLLLANYRSDGTLKQLYEKYGGVPEVVDVLKSIGY